MTEKTLTTENIKPALDALRGELAPWPVVAMKQDKLNGTQKAAINSGITSGLVAQIGANTAAIRALESAITGTGLRALVVASLPAVGTQGILYIVPVTTYDPATDADVVNYSNEYIWIVAPDAPVTQGYYEQVGQTGIVINNGQLTITVNGTSVGTFTANQSGDTTAAITVPTNSDYVDLTTAQTAAGVKTFSDGIVGNVTGTASRSVADADGNTISSTYGKLAGSQTWTGSNTFSGLKSTGVIRVEKSTGDTEFEIVNSEVDATTNTLTRQDDIRFYDKNTKITGGLRLTYTTDTGTKIELYARSWKADGTAAYNRSLTVYTNGQTGEYYTTLETNFNPKTTGVYSLGTSSYRWSSVYADSYYYGTTAWGLDKSNTWTGVNTFSVATAESIAVKHTTYKGAILFRTNGVTNFKNYNTFFKWDINGYDNTFGLYRSVGVLGDTTAGATDEDIDTSFSLWKAHIRSKSLDLVDAVKATNDGTENSLKPITTSVTDLGTSTNKFKTLNGINPGALSLPDFTSETGVSLSAGVNTYTPTFSGWLSISTTGDISVVCGNFCHKATDMISVPVIAGKTYTVTMPSSATGYFYPCLGNV